MIRIQMGRINNVIAKDGTYDDRRGAAPKRVRIGIDPAETISVARGVPTYIFLEDQSGLTRRIVQQRKGPFTIVPMLRAPAGIQTNDTPGQWYKIEVGAAAQPAQSLPLSFLECGAKGRSLVPFTVVLEQAS